MHHAVYVGLGLSALFGLIGPAVARRVAPAAAGWLLSIGGLLSAFSAAAVLALLGVTLVAQNPEVAEQGHWSTTVLRHADPVRWPVATASLAALAIILWRFGRVVIGRARAMTAAYRTSRLLVSAGDLVVLPDLTADAYAVPGHPGRVVVTHGMLALLTPPERDALLSHERSHLRHGHHWHRAAVDVATALNPLLRPLAAAQQWTVERWADEDATVSSDRIVAASALARAAAATRSAARRPTVALAAADTSVERRIAALLDGPPRRHPQLLGVAALVVVLSLAATFEAARDTAVLFHAAGFVHHAHLTLRHTHR
jgi:Zn-dependent protease with chaperone function